MLNTEINFKKYIVWFWGIVLASIFMVFLFFFLLSKGLLGFMPSFEELENPKNVLASEMISADDKILDKYFIRENRITNEGCCPNCGETIAGVWK